jgi:hypothetical protein
MNSTKYQLRTIKDVIGTNSGAFGKTGAGTSEPESSAFLIFLIFLRTPGKKNSPQSEFRAKSYARFKEDPLN